MHDFKTLLSNLEEECAQAFCIWRPSFLDHPYPGSPPLIKEVGLKNTLNQVVLDSPPVIRGGGGGWGGAQGPGGFLRGWGLNIIYFSWGWNSGQVLAIWLLQHQSASDRDCVTSVHEALSSLKSIVFGNDCPEVLRTALETLRDTELHGSRGFLED